MLRAILKATGICALEPERAARALVDGGLTPPYALRLQKAGMIKSSPQKIIAQGTDWRFLNELKKELKG